MRIGVICRCDNTGLGLQTHNFYKHMHPHKTLVLDWKHIKGLPSHLERYQKGNVTIVKEITDEVLRSFLEDLDIVFTIETPYNNNLWDIAREMGVKTVLECNYEFLSAGFKPDLVLAPSVWNLAHIREMFPTAIYNPIPVDTKLLTPHRRQSAHTFLHIRGMNAIHDRNGTQTLLDALPHIKSKDIKIIIASQVGNLFVPDERVEVISEVENYEDLYEGCDALIFPRRYGGLCLPFNEAMAKGMPIIASDIEPNNILISRQLLLPAKKIRDFMCWQKIDVYDVDPRDLADAIDYLVENKKSYMMLKQEALRTAKQLSWDNNRYNEIFAKLLEKDEKKEV